MPNQVMTRMACALGVTLAAVSAISAQTAPSRAVEQPRPEWAKDVTVLVIAPDGTWGTATEPSVGEALGKAIANCKNKYQHEIGCGHRSTIIREGWSIAIRCGQENIIVAEKTLAAAEQAAVDSELSLRRDYKPGMPPCVRIVSVSPDGGIIAPHVAHLLQFVMDRSQ